MSSDVWSAYLTELEAWIVEQSRRLAAGEIDSLLGEAVDRPCVDGVVPAALAARALAAVEQLDGLQSQLRRCKDEVGSQLHQVQRQASPAGSPASVYVDGYS